MTFVKKENGMECGIRGVINFDSEIENTIQAQVQTKIILLAFLVSDHDRDRYTAAPLLLYRIYETSKP